MTLYDPSPVQVADLGTQFFLRPSDVGQPGVTRAKASAPRLAEINTYVPIQVLDVPELTPDVLKAYQVVVLTHQNLAEQLRVNDATHDTGTHFIAADARGLFGRVFNDFGSQFLCKDPTGEAPLSGMVVSVERDARGTVTTLDETRHGLQDGDTVTFSEVEGMTELNDMPPRPVTVTGPYTFTIGDTSSFGEYKGGGVFRQVKQPAMLSFKSLRESLAAPEFLISDFAKMERPPVLHAAFEALSAFEAEAQRSPRPRNAEDAAVVLAKTRELLAARGQAPDAEGDKALASLVSELAYQASGDLSPMVAFIGGFVAQEVLKACSGKFHPLVQYLYVDSLEALPDGVAQLPESEFAPQNSRYDGQAVSYTHLTLPTNREV